MPVSFDRDLVFVHLHKTGGMSIARSLRDAGVRLDFVNGSLEEKLRGRSDADVERIMTALRHVRPRATPGIALEHLPALALREMVGVFWRLAYKVSIVRNPWDRFVSLYEHALGLLDDPWHVARPGAFDDHVRDSDSFERFVLEFPANGPDMSAQLSDESGADMMDFIGRFENLEADFAQICERIGVVAPLVHVNASGRGAYADYYTPKTQAAVARRFARDIDRFEYRF